MKERKSKDVSFPAGQAIAEAQLQVEAVAAADIMMVPMLPVGLLEK